MIFYVLFATFLVWIFWHNIRTTYWLLTDGQEGKAVITGSSPLRRRDESLDYSYEVNNTRYYGSSPRSWLEKPYWGVQIGGQSVVYYSASHPWLSSVRKPKEVVSLFDGSLIGAIVLAFLWWWPKVFHPKPASTSLRKTRTGPANHFTRRRFRSKMSE
jgi:hypothetical protein